MEDLYGLGLIGGVIGGLMIIFKLFDRFVPDNKLPWKNGNGKIPACPIKDNSEIKELSRQKLAQMEKQTDILNKIHENLVDQKADHRIMLDRLGRDK